jgi:hypothetical protein
MRLSYALVFTVRLAGSTWKSAILDSQQEVALDLDPAGPFRFYERV